MKEFNCPELASKWLKAGKILLHPTEGLWGIGCIVDSTAINLLSNLKRRKNKKGYIILVEFKLYKKLPFNLSYSDLEKLNTSELTISKLREEIIKKGILF